MSTIDLHKAMGYIASCCPFAYFPGVPVNCEKIKLLREKKGLTQEQAALAAGMKSRQHWNNVESGRQASVTIDLLERIAKVVGAKVADLLK